MLSQKSQVSPAPLSPAEGANDGSSGQLVEMPKASAVDVGVVVEVGAVVSVADAVAKAAGQDPLDWPLGGAAAPGDEEEQAGAVRVSELVQAADLCSRLVPSSLQSAFYWTSLA